jgi:hypothetical protein
MKQIENDRFVDYVMFMRDGHVIDLSGMTVIEAGEFVSEIERLANEGTRLVCGVRFIVQGAGKPARQLES